MSEEVFVITKLKNAVPWIYVISDLKGGEIVGTFYKKESQKTKQKEFMRAKVIKRTGDKLYVKWKGYDNSIKSWTDKKDILQMSEYFPKPKFLGANLKVKLDLSNYAIKAELKNATGVDTSDFAKTN